MKGLELWHHDNMHYANQTNFHVCQSHIENSVDRKWLTNDFINILKHILAVIEENKDLFSPIESEGSS